MTAAPYDPTLKDLVEIEPESWPTFLGCPTGPTTVIDADIATVSGAADKALRVATDPRAAAWCCCGRRLIRRN